MINGKIGVLGVGYWGTKHVEEYIDLGVEVVACDIDVSRLGFVEDKYGIKTVENFDKFINDPEIVGVSVCTPNETHFNFAMKLLKAGKHVLVEKPIAMNVDQGWRLVNYAKDSNSILFVGHIFRYNNAINKLKALVENNELGTPWVIKFRWTNTERVFYDRDVIFDLAVHPFDIFLYLFNKPPSELSCVGSSFRRSEDKGPEVAFINGRLNDLVLNIEVSWITPPKRREAILIGSEKSAFVDALKQTITILEGQKYYDVDIIPNNTIRDMLKEFLNLIQNPKSKKLSDGIVGVEVLQLVELAFRSYKEKRTLKYYWG